MIRSSSLFVAALAMAVLTACSDSQSPVAPGASTPSHAVHATTVAAIGDTTVQTFTVAPGWNDTYVIDGVHKVDIMANSVCDPEVSTYGPGEWDKPCVTISRPLTFTARSWTDGNGHARVSFSPDVRFAPGRTNVLTLKDRVTSSAMASGRILWCPTGSDACADEALSDGTLTTQLNANGTLSRRVKHFSGYTVIAD